MSIKWQLRRRERLSLERFYRDAVLLAAGKVEHSLVKLLRQRIHGPACGYLPGYSEL